MIKTLSLFTGAGGLDLGFEAAGFTIVAAVDTMKESCDTLRRNRPGTHVFGPPFHYGDIRMFGTKVFEEATGLKAGEIDMIIGGPPCQPFSMAAAQRFLKTDKKFKREGFNSDKGSLIFEYLRVIAEFKPKAFLIENVPGFVDIDGGKTVDNVKHVLESKGYNIYGPAILDAADFGVPQRRKRMFIIGTLLKTNFEMPISDFGNGTLNSHTAVAQALYDIPANAINNTSRKHKKSSVERYQTLKFGQREKRGRVDRLDPLLPSKTIIAGGSNGGGRSHLHPYIARTMTVRECARLQTFPDNYLFVGKNGRQFTQVGNAVPPLLAEKVARQIGKCFFGLTYKIPPVHEMKNIDLEKANKILQRNSLFVEEYYSYTDSAAEIIKSVIKSTKRKVLKKRDKKVLKMHLVHV